MLARIRSAAVLGVDACLVDVEIDIAHGLPTCATAGGYGADCLSASTISST
jgi:hypothetical protein